MFRYQQGLLIRMDRAEHDPARDAAKEKQVRPFTAWLRAMQGRQAPLNPACEEALDEFAVMVEEFRLAVFAPEVKRTLKISPQRLRRRMAEIEEICQAME